MSKPLISIIETPNPDAYVFQVQETLVASGTHEFLNGSDVSSSPLAERILLLNGVELIMIAPKFVTVRKDPEISWQPLAERVAQQLNAFLISGDMAIIEDIPKSESNDYSELEQRILTILDEEIRPAIAQDGGDVIYHGFEDGIVKLELIGACGTCPSSTATLYYGIQNLLMEEIPEVTGIEEINPYDS